jgi:hypothetical protein
MIAATLMHLGFSLDDFEVIQDEHGVRLSRWLSDKPRPTDAEIAAAALPAAQAAKRFAIKTAARQIILSRYPDWRQANLTARAVELVSLGETSGPEWQQMQSIWAWIQSVRARSDLLEADVAACTTVEAVKGIVIGGWPE